MKRQSIFRIFVSSSHDIRSQWIANYFQDNFLVLPGEQNHNVIFQVAGKIICFKAWLKLTSFSEEKVALARNGPHVHQNSKIVRQRTSEKRTNSMLWLTRWFSDCCDTNPTKLGIFFFLLVLFFFVLVLILNFFFFDLL